MTNHQPEAIDPDSLLRDDNGDPIGTRQYCIDQGLPSVAGDGLVAALSALSPDDIAKVLFHRQSVEQAKGMLMFIYDIDDDRALDLLAMRAKNAKVTLPALAEHLVGELRAIPRDRGTDIRSACDALLVDASDSITPALKGL